MTDRLLVLAAHADDEVLMCGGLLAKWTNPAHVWVATQGRVTRTSHDQAAIPDELERACKILHATHAQGHFPDQHLDAVPLLNLVQAIEDVVASIRPTVVIGHSLQDVNADHRRMAEAVLTACRPCSYHGLLYAAEVPGSGDWWASRWIPTTFVSLWPQHLEAKLAALACYQSEGKAMPHARNPSNLEARARYWGSIAHVPLAEPLQLLREIQR